MKINYQLQFLGVCLFVTRLAYGTPIQVKLDNNVHAIKINNQYIWIKGVPLKKQLTSHCFKKKILSLILPITLLKPSVSCGLTSLEVEKSNLRKAFQAGINVPRILGSGPNFLIMSDLGQSLEKFILNRPPHLRLLLLCQAHTALIEMHHKNIVQGRGMIKDMVINLQKKIGFIDFAENPVNFMSLTQAKVRDRIGFLYSALPLLPQQQQAFLTKTVLNPISSEEFKILYKLFRQLENIYWIIKPFSKRIGQDGQRAFILFSNLKLYYALKTANLKTPQR